MTLEKFLAMGLLVGLLAGSSKAEELSNTSNTTTLPANAALQYWRAFLVLDLNREDIDLLAAWEHAPLDETSQKLISTTEVYLDHVVRGAKIRRCDWGLTLEDGPYVLVPHLVKSRDFARLACLRGRYRFEHEDPQGAIEDFVTALTLARHVAAQGDSLVSVLVDCAIERMVLRALGRYLPSLSPGELDALTQHLRNLPLSASFESTLKNERLGFIDWVIRQIEVGTKDGTIERSLGKLEEALGDDPEYAALIESARTDPARALAQLEELGEVYRRLGRAGGQPPAEFRKVAESLNDLAEKLPLARNLLPGAYEAYFSMAKARTRMAMLEAAVLTLRKGPEELSKFRGPYETAPFVLERTEGGFTLTSGVEFDGENVVLRVGG